MSYFNNFSKGSEWRRWDLHFHTKGTNKNDNFTSADFDSFCNILFRKAFEKRVCALGITDYFSIENYKKVVNYVNNIDKIEIFSTEEKEFIKSILIIPNVELRMLPVTDSGRLINIHCLFNPSYISSIDNDFFNSIEYAAGPGKKYKMNRQGIIDLGKNLQLGANDESAYIKGINNYLVTHDQLQKLLDENENFRDNTLIGVSNSNQDGASALQKHYDLFEDEAASSLDGVRKAIYSISDFIFSSNDSDIKYFLGQKKDNKNTVISKCGSIKPCVHGSDAHTESKLFEPNLNRYCWIKADLTFEGLKQIIYEPEERVKIQEFSPALDFDKFAFTEIEITDTMKVIQGENLNFEKNAIPLNQNLVTIIGGRGTGKSILINYLGNGFKQYNGLNNGLTDKVLFNLSEKFIVKWKKSIQSTDELFIINKQYDLPFLFISQSEVKEKVKNTRDLGNEIKKILELENLFFDRKADDTIQGYTTEFDINQDWFQKKDEFNNPINSKSFVELEIQKNKNLLDIITTEENKDKLERYSVNIEKIQTSETDVLNIEKLINLIDDFQISVNEKITNLKRNIPIVDFSPQKKAIFDAISAIELEHQEAQRENEEIKNDFKEFKGDLSSLLSSVERFRTTISVYERRIIEIEGKEKLLAAALENKKKIADLINVELHRQKKSIDESWDKLLQGKNSWNPDQKELMKKIINNREIKIEGEIVFNKTVFFDLVKDSLDGRTFKGKQNHKELESLLGILDLQTYIDFLKNTDTSLIKVDYYLLNGRKEFERIFYDLRTRSSYLYVQPKITYKGKPLSRISVGQRGTIYLCLKLATNIFSQPIIFDQPEDDLDNDFIFNDLINIFKEIKRYRQVIIVTHNANIVVNADAEQVIVATNNEEKLSYQSGSLEKTEINNSVCNILEGGKIAFQQRKNKYHFRSN